MQGTPEGVEDNGSLTRVAAFPIGIDPDRFARALEQMEVKAHIAQLLNRYAGRKVSSTDSLHMTEAKDVTNFLLYKHWKNTIINLRR